MENFINNLEKKAQDFTTLEKEVIKFIKSDPNVVNNITLTQFADLIFVSSATISRTLKKLGFEGFSEFKYRLNEVLSNGSQEKINNENGNANYFLELVDNIQETLTSIGQDSTNQFVEQIQTKQSIAVIGVGASTSIAQDLSRRLFMLGYNASSRSDWDELEWQSKRLTSNDLAIIVSLSGETKQLVSYVKEMKKKDVFIVLIVAMSDTTIEQFADLSIKGKSKIIYYQGSDVSFRSPLTAIIDYLIYHLATN